MPSNWREYSRFSGLPTRRSRPSACPVGVIRDRVGQGRRWYLSASLRKRPKYCSAKNERNCQKRSDHTRFGLHFMSWVPSVRFQPLGRGIISTFAISRSPPGRKVLGFRYYTRRVVRGHMQRREFITLLGGAVAAWPLIARAQQPDRMRRIGVLTPGAADEPENKARIAAFLLGLRELGWTDGSNVQIVYRWSGGNAAAHRRNAAGIGRARPGSNPSRLAARRGTIAAGNPHCADRVRDRSRSGWFRLCQRSVAAGRQRHRLYDVRIQFVWEMAGAAQADRAGRDASGGPSRSRHSGRDRPVRRNPVRGAFGWRRGEPSQPKQRGRDRNDVAAFARSPKRGLISGRGVSRRFLITIFTSRPTPPTISPPPIAKNSPRRPPTSLLSFILTN